MYKTDEKKTGAFARSYKKIFTETGNDDFHEEHRQHINDWYEDFTQSVNDDEEIPLKDENE